MRLFIILHHRTDKVWELLEPYLHGREGVGGGMAHGDRQFHNAVFWLLRIGVDYLATGTGKRSLAVLGVERKWCENDYLKSSNPNQNLSGL